MSAPRVVHWNAPLEEYQREATALLDALGEGDESAMWRFKWEHPRLRGSSASAAHSGSLGPDDARTVIAREYGFEDWPQLIAFTDACRNDPSVSLFERAVEAVVSGDMEGLRALLAEHPEVIRRRSRRRHHATLLHYIACNGVEGGRQRTPPNAVEVARLLVSSGADVNATANMYESECSTLSLLVSSSPPADAELQGELVEVLLEHGARFDAGNGAWSSALRTALVFGFVDTAETLARRGAPLDLVSAAGLGRLDEVTRLLPQADAISRHMAFAMACQLGRADVVRLLLDSGEDPNRYNPPGHHSHATALHHAALGGHVDVVRLLVERGARLDVRDTIYEGTAVDWALHEGRAEVAAYLRQQAESGA